MIQINMSDVMNVINNCEPYLIALAVLLIAAILVIIAVRRLAVPRRKLCYPQLVGTIQLSGGRRHVKKYIWSF